MVWSEVSIASVGYTLNLEAWVQPKHYTIDAINACSKVKTVAHLRSLKIILGRSLSCSHLLMVLQKLSHVKLRVKVE